MASPVSRWGARPPSEYVAPLQTHQPSPCHVSSPQRLASKSAGHLPMASSSRACKSLPWMGMCVTHCPHPQWEEAVGPSRTLAAVGPQTCQAMAALWWQPRRPTLCRPWTTMQCQETAASSWLGHNRLRARPLQAPAPVLRPLAAVLPPHL